MTSAANGAEWIHFRTFDYHTKQVTRRPYYPVRRLRDFQAHQGVSARGAGPLADAVRRSPTAAPGVYLRAVEGSGLLQAVILDHICFARESRLCARIQPSEVQNAATR